MITPVEAPAEPVVEEPMPEPVVPEGPGFDVSLEGGFEHDFDSADAGRTLHSEIVGRNAGGNGCDPTRCRDPEFHGLHGS